MAKASKPSAKDDQPLTFEAALARLEEIAAKLEDGNLALDEAITLAEEGLTLSAYCDTQLTAAQGKVEQLVSRMGAATVEPFPNTGEEEE